MGFNSAFKGLNLLKNPGNGRLDNLNDLVLNVLRLPMFGNYVEVILIKQKGRDGENCMRCFVIMCPLYNILLA